MQTDANREQIQSSNFRVFTASLALWQMLAKWVLLLQVVSLRPYFNPINKGPAACRSFFIMLMLGPKMGPKAIFEHKSRAQSGP